MPSASPRIRSAALAACLVLIGATAAGCETTQEKAEKQQERAAHILKAREERQKLKKKQREKSQKHHGKDQEKGKKG